eukprot:TRINITY_DN2102_c0_g1_i4.p2 TRINITY_DN2102_c0_g1~~TRINITY_DN2102_c0_g1_i4.p2  ORF type:complete len:101 (+),score=30.86 TRINITY_DN2102_c0_g1_i4:54-356(+)
MVFWFFFFFFQAEDGIRDVERSRGLGDVYKRQEVSMQHEIITSIDFGSKKLSASMATYTKEGDVEILGIESYKSMGIEKGLVTDVEKCKEAVISLSLIHI